MTPQRHAIRAARIAYGKCAKRVEAKITANGLSESLSEQVIGIGVAIDWLRRAFEMEDISFLGDQLNNSEHKTSFVELLRFNFSWFGLNAIFARPSLLNLVGKPKTNGEFQEFLVLFNAAPLPNASTQIATLHALLAKQTAPRLPGRLRGTSVSTLSAIQTKYLQHATLRGKPAKDIASAAASGRISALNLATLLYAFRNWSVHGASLDGSFGTRPGFVRYVDVLQEVIAEVHCSTASKLEACI